MLYIRIVCGEYAFSLFVILHDSLATTQMRACTTFEHVSGISLFLSLSLFIFLALFRFSSFSLSSSPLFYLLLSIYLAHSHALSLADFSLFLSPTLRVLTCRFTKSALLSIIKTLLRMKCNSISKDTREFE